MAGAVGQTRAKRLASLARADEVRLRRSALWKEVRALPTGPSALRCADLLRDADPALGSLRVSVFLFRWPRRLLRREARRWMALAGVSEARTLGALTPRQAIILAEALEARAERLAKRSP